MPKSIQRSVRGLVGAVVCLGLWQLADQLHWIDPTFIPGPIEVGRRIWQLFGTAEFRVDFVATLLAWLIAILSATAVAVPLGLLLGSMPVLRSALSAVVDMLRPIPTVTLIPLVLTAFGDGAQIKIILAAFASIWPILFNVIYGLREVDPLFVDTAKAFRTGRLRTALAVRLPYIAPFALTGIRLSAAISLVVVVSTEFIDNAGIGFGSYVVLNGEQTGDTPMVIGGVVIAGILGCLVNALLQGAQHRWFSWATEGA
jgi:NitT/TauT family transport system permease protein